MSTPTPTTPLDIVKYRAHIDDALRALFDDAATRAQSIDPVYAELLASTREYLLRSGKRLRPYLTYLAYGDANQTDITGVAASQELFHNYLLIHDDVIDRDLIRHGGPNIAGEYYQKFKDRHITPTEALHHATSYALLAGNASCALGLELIIASAFSPGRKLAAMQCVHQMLFEEMGGQLTDISVSLPGAAPATIDQLLKIARYKTAAYSFITPLQTGAIMAGASSATQEQLHKYGEALGVAFQLADDLLGVFGDEAALGKPIHSDMREGKHTLLNHYALANATPEQTQTLKRIWGSRTAGDAELQKVRALLRDTGADAKVTKLAETYLHEALTALKKSSVAPAFEAQLIELAYFCVRRQH